MIDPFWGWILTITGVSSIALVGAGREKHGWLLGALAQLLWLAYAITSDQLGFVFASLAYGWVFIRNYLSARKDSSANESSDPSYDPLLFATAMLATDESAGQRAQAQPSPWREHPRAPMCYTVPRVVLERIADQRSQQTMKRIEAAYLETLGADIDANGLKEPITIVVDKGGKVCLKDGHHRIATGRLEEFPVYIQTATRSSRRGANITELIDLMKRGIDE